MRVEKLTPFFRKYENRRVPYITALASLNGKRDKLYLLVLNRDLSGEREVLILFDTKAGPETHADCVYIRGLEGKAFRPSPKAAILTGPSVGANNETNPDTVRIVTANVDAPAGTAFRYAFKPFSLTGIEFGMAQPGAAPRQGRAGNRSPN
jgi:alpha-L-arabinofuranosidase